mmetsp:Transcript_88767/g.287430  ORF Transcript_88767/g.287430 Transcript_88767/m.287430 type:complete len:251 (+) Transcript_88767:165-917(+)
MGRPSRETTGCHTSTEAPQAMHRRKCVARSAFVLNAMFTPLPRAGACTTTNCRKMHAAKAMQRVGLRCMPAKTLSSRDRLRQLIQLKSCMKAKAQKMRPWCSVAGTVSSRPMTVSMAMLSRMLLFMSRKPPVTGQVPQSLTSWGQAGPAACSTKIASTAVWKSDCPTILHHISGDTRRWFRPWGARSSTRLSGSSDASERAPRELKMMLTHRICVTPRGTWFTATMLNKQTRAAVRFDVSCTCRNFATES